MRRENWKAYFSFTKKERIAVAILVSIIIACFLLPYFLPSNKTIPVIDKNLQQQIDALQESDNTQKYSSAKNNTYTRNDTSYNTTIKKELFYFDPNTLDFDGWKKLGLNDKTAHTILNYRNKGGSFHKPEDIRKIYGLKEDQANELIPFIRITSQQDKPYSQENKKTTEESPKQIHQPIKTIDINTATAEEWKSLPGIGDVLSKRIVKFRTSIHGFSSVTDLKRTYGLSDSAYQIILPYLAFSDSTSKNK